MANDLTITDPAAPPAWLAGFLEDTPNLAPRDTVPSLTYAGKTWTVSVKGEKTPLMRVNEDGDEEPLPIMRVVILDFNANRGRNYYKQGFDPDKPMKPDCWSDDAKKASSQITEPPFEGWTGKCDGCPMSIKGSKVTDAGKDVTACQLHRMVAVVPISKKAIFHSPLRMRLAITSLYDKDNPQEQQGWYAFDNYIAYLRKMRSGGHTASMVTKMKFDNAVNYPKVLFSQDRWVTAEEMEPIAALVKSEEVKDLLSAKWTSNGSDGTRTEEPAPAPVAAKPEPKPAVKPEPTVAVVRQAVATPANIKSAPKPAPAPANDEEGDDDNGMTALQGEVIPPKPPKGNGTAAVTAAKGNGKGAGKTPPVVTKAVPEGLGDLLTDWDG
jgi:hypothetical protein